MSSTPKASILTPTFNKFEMIKDLDASLNQQIKTPYEFIVLDNGDGSTAKIPGINVIKGTNLGNFGSMNNLMASYAMSEVLIFLNNDTIARTDFVTDMVSILDSRPEIGIVGAVLYYPDERLQHSGIIIQQDLHPANLGERAIKKLSLDEKKCRPYYWDGMRAFQAVTGACMAIRREDFFKIGGFHDEFSWNFEDVDLCFRMQFYLNKICIVSPLSVLTHREFESGGNRNQEINLSLLQGRWRGIVKADDYLFTQDCAPTATASK